MGQSTEDLRYEIAETREQLGGTLDAIGDRRRWLCGRRCSYPARDGHGLPMVPLAPHPDDEG